MQIQGFKLSLDLQFLISFGGSCVVLLLISALRLQLDVQKQIEILTRQKVIVRAFQLVRITNDHDNFEFFLDLQPILLNLLVQNSNDFFLLILLHFELGWVDESGRTHQHLLDGLDILLV